MIIERLNISMDGEITIPKELLIMLGFKDSAECIVYKDKLIIRPFSGSRESVFTEGMPKQYNLWELDCKDLSIQFKDQQVTYTH